MGTKNNRRRMRLIYGLFYALSSRSTEGWLESFFYFRLNLKYSFRYKVDKFRCYLYVGMPLDIGLYFGRFDFVNCVVSGGYIVTQLSKNTFWTLFHMVV